MKNSRGFALLTTILVLVLFSALTAAFMPAALSSSRASVAMMQSEKIIYIAEGAAESALAELLMALGDGYLEDDELAAIQPPPMWVADGWLFPEWKPEKVDTQFVETISGGPFAGMSALSQKLRVSVRAEDSWGSSHAMVVDARAQAIPVFQFGIFFDGDLEATNGPPLEFVGRVHSNGNIYLSSDNAWYREIITTPGSIIHDRKDFHDVEFGVYINDEADNEVLLDFDSRTEPDPEAFKARSCLQFDCRVQTSAFGVTTLDMPLPQGMDPYEVVRPQEADDTEQEKRVKYAWQADLYVDPIVNDLTDEHICDVVEALDAMIPQCKDAIQFTWEAFYDGREGHWVDVLEIDADKLPPELRILYVHFEPGWVGFDVQADGVHPVVRVKNGVKLNGPLTIVTDNPLYVQGNYNITNKKPAALVGDAVTILSESWSDSNLPLSTANATTVNAAIMAGLVPTPCDHEEVGCPGGYQDFYSGGIENFPRFLEDWSGVTLTYRGSLVSMFESQVATGTWNGSYYSPPIRDWSFDIDMLDPTNLPPGTPVVGYIVRTSVREVS